jgi:2-polyprenyl-6-hydroxyphenyl methylase/3-demethylubiquinone-9 3-methyltransferase
VPIDNTIYDKPGDIWWDESQAFSALRTMINPGRVPYFRGVLVEKLHLDPHGLRALEVGAGGGLLTEELAKLGLAMSGVDPSERSVATARAHAARYALPIEYLVGVGEHLPFEEASFDVVFCCDVLEHVQDLRQVITEIARVLRPGGVFLYDTINRTLFSKLAIIKLAQDWPLTRFVPANLHDWQMFIKPGELKTTMARYGLRNKDVVGLRPGANPLAMLLGIGRLKTGKASYGALGREFAYKRCKGTMGSYMGYAVKDRPAASP